MKLLKESKKVLFYIILLLVTLVACLIVKYNFMNYVQLLDNNITNYIYENLTNEKLTIIMKIITFFGSYWFLIPLATFLLFYLKKEKRGLLISLNILFVFITNRLLKLIFDRERPVSNFIVEKGSSFPSAHTMCSVCFYGFLLALLWNKYKKKNIRIVLLCLYIILVSLIGFSRVYLQAHYFTDVLFGLIYGLICLLLFINIIKEQKKE